MLSAKPRWRKRLPLVFGQCVLGKGFFEGPVSEKQGRGMGVPTKSKERFTALAQHLANPLNTVGVRYSGIGERIGINPSGSGDFWILYACIEKVAATAGNNSVRWSNLSNSKVTWFLTWYRQWRNLNNNMFTVNELCDKMSFATFDSGYVTAP